ncbi:MAG: AraC family transcriptional regulator [Lachnospiraceae bacterium]|nr:AraC family transcriptional regulator [Lachnospiraceae bacterium]
MEDIEYLFMLEFQVAGITGKFITFSAEYQAPDASSYYHHHHHHFELHYVQEGTCVLTSGGENLHVETGQFCIFAPNRYHSIRETSPNLKKMCLGFELPAFSADMDKRAAAILLPFSSFSYYTGSADNIKNTLQKISDTATGSQTDFFIQEELRSLLSLLVLELAWFIGPTSQDMPDNKITLDLKRNFIIDTFFNQNFHLHDGDQILADQLYLSSRQLNRILKSIYGKSYQEKILEIRLEVSLDLLKHSSKSITEISELTGYNSPASFCYFIKKATGLTPGKIRRSAASQT